MIGLDNKTVGQMPPNAISDYRSSPYASVETMARATQTLLSTQAAWPSPAALASEVGDA
jgi:hypothetical protein